MRPWISGFAVHRIFVGFAKRRDGARGDHADRAAIHRIYVTDMERGRRNPATTVAAKLAVPFGMPAVRLPD